MIAVGFKDQGMEGPLILEPEKDEDLRGWAVRFSASLGLVDLPVITSIEVEEIRQAGGVRGLTWRNEAGPSLIISVRGAAHQVAVDLRPTSQTRRKHVWVDLVEVDCRAFLVPWGFAHGWQALTPGAAILRIGTGKGTGAIMGIRPDDPALGIEWPHKPVQFSPRDLSWPLAE